jgi:outer membrane lipoprotein-sorting protein
MNKINYKLQLLYKNKLSDSIKLYLLIVLSFFPIVTNAQQTGLSIMQKMDQLKKPSDSETKIKMTLVSKKGDKERSRSRVLTTIEKKYEDDIYKLKSILRFSEPKEVNGTAFLTWDRIDTKFDDQWLYLPALKKVKRIRAKDKERSFMGTDFSYEDLSGRDLKSDEYELIGEDIVHGTQCYKINAIPLEKGTQYGSRLIWIDKENFLIKRVEFYNKKNKQIKILDIPYHVKNGSYWTQTKLVMKNLKNGHRTELDIIKVIYDQGLKDNVFTESYLKRN